MFNMYPLLIVDLTVNSVKTNKHQRVEKRVKEWKLNDEKLHQIFEEKCAKEM